MRAPHCAADRVRVPHHAAILGYYYTCVNAGVRAIPAFAYVHIFPAPRRIVSPDQAAPVDLLSIHKLTLRNTRPRSYCEPHTRRHGRTHARMEGGTHAHTHRSERKRTGTHARMHARMIADTHARTGRHRYTTYMAIALSIKL